MANRFEKAGCNPISHTSSRRLHGSISFFLFLGHIISTGKKYGSRNFAIAILALTCLCANAQPSLIKNAPTSQRYIAALYQIQKLQNEAQKSRLALDSILEYAQKENDQFLRWEAYVAWAKYMAETAQQLNKKLVFFNEVWPFIKKCDEDEIKGFYYHELGKVYYQSRDFNNAFRYIVRATDIFERIGYNHLRLGALYTCDMFSFYYCFEDYPLAARYSKLSVSLNDTFPASLVSRLNDLGCPI